MYTIYDLVLILKNKCNRLEIRKKVHQKIYPLGCQCCSRTGYNSGRWDEVESLFIFYSYLLTPLTSSSWHATLNPIVFMHWNLHRQQTSFKISRVHYHAKL